MNTNLRPTLWAMFFAIIMLIWLKWEGANAPKPAIDVNNSSTVELQDKKIPSQSNALNNEVAVNSETSIATKQRLIHIKTDVLDLTIDTVGGKIVESKLLNYSESIKDKTPIKLLSYENGRRFYFETALTSKSHIKNATHAELFNADKSEYNLEGESVSVPLTWEADGVKVTKTYTFHKGKYNFDVKQHIENNSSETWHGYQYSQLLRDELKIKTGLTTFNTFAGGVYSTPEDKYEKVSFEKLGEGVNIKDVTGGWVGMMQHYFIGAIIPDQTSQGTIFSQKTNSGAYILRTYGAYQNIAAGQSATFTASGFVGPKIKNELAKVAPHLDKATDYGPLFFLSELLFNVLDWVHSVLKNWGWAIVLVTIAIKLILFPLAAKSFKSMAKMRKFQPEMERIRKNCGDDRQLVGQKTMELYKKEGINPASGCLPIVVQIPIFLAFYYMLMESVELRQAPWIFWIHDLSLRDPYYILPIINTGLMFVQQKLNPPPTDPIQKKVMTFLPLVFGLMFMVFPAGLVLYWAVSNLFSIVQQYVITKKYKAL